MNKVVGIALLTFLACGQVQIVMSESAQSQSLQDRKFEAERLFKLGDQQIDKNLFRESILDFESALAIYREIKDLSGTSNSLRKLGGIYFALEDYLKEISFYQQSLEIVRQIGDKGDEAMLLRSIGSAYNSLKEYRQAISYYEQSLGIWQQIGGKIGRVGTMKAIGDVFYSLKEYRQAISYYEQSLGIWRELLGGKRGEASSLSAIGNAYYHLGEIQKSITYLEQALAIRLKLANYTCPNNSSSEACVAIFKNDQGKLFNSLGIAYTAESNFQKAIDSLQQALEIYKQLGNHDGEGIVLTNLGKVYITLGQYQKAVEYFQRSLPIVKQFRNCNCEVRTLLSLGGAYSSLGKYQEALKYSQQSLKIAKQNGDRDGEGSSFVGLGNTYILLGQYQKATDYFQQSLEIFSQTGNNASLSASLYSLGYMYTIFNQLQKANQSFQQSIVIAKGIGFREGERSSFIGLGYVYENSKQSELAIISYKQAINISESIRADILTLKKEEQTSYLKTISASYKNLSDLLLKQGRVMEALQVLDLLKVQELEDYLKNIKGSDRSAQGIRLLEPEKAISDKLLAISFENSPEINSQLAKQIQQLPKSEINKVPDYLQKIPQGTALLYPLILGDRLEIILFSPNTIPISRSVKISKENLEELINDFVKGLRDSGSEDHKEPAAELYKLLIKPIEAELIQAKTTTILYAPDGILRYIPLAAFYDGKQWLAEKYRINNLIAYSLFDFAPNLKTQPNILAGAFGGKKGERKFGQNALPATLIEVQAIANSFQNSVTLIEDQFSRKAIESKFQDHNILHLATHAQFNTGTPDNSFIIFGNGDKIKLNEITDWQIPNIDLIVLSACETGTSTLGNGVEILGFGYQIQKAGAKNAIASLWKVNDEGTQVLMEAFYGELKKGDLSSTEALHRAQVALIKSPKYNHPFYWSAFFAIGNGL